MRRLDRQSIAITRIRWPRAAQWELERQVLSTVARRDSLELDATVATMRALHVIRARRHASYRLHAITNPDTNTVRVFAEPRTARLARFAILSKAGIAGGTVIPYERALLRYRLRRARRAGA